VTADHLEQAADRAEKLACAITDDGYEPNSDLIGRIAQHLMYLAGLIRGGAVQAPKTDHWGRRVVPNSLAEQAIPSFKISAVGDSEATFRNRWHEAATERDVLVRAARDHLNGQCGRNSQRLRDTLQAVEAGGKFPVPADDRVRRELWHVLDRMPASDDDLIATVATLQANHLDMAEQRKKLVAQRGGLLAAAKELIRRLVDRQDAHYALTELQEIVAAIDSADSRPGP
jgi:hypothetical protein